MAQISAVFFDFGNVLFSFLPEKRLKKMCAASGISEKKLYHTLWASGFSDACDAGDYTSQEMFEQACNLLQWFPNYSTFKNLWTSAFELDTQVFSLATHIQPNIKTGILSNNPEILREMLHEDFPQVEKQFDPIIFSSAFKITKPNVGIFQKAATEIGQATNEILFIDDSEKYILSAKNLGMQTIHFTNPEALTSQLQNFGILD